MLHRGWRKKQDLWPEYWLGLENEIIRHFWVSLQRWINVIIRKKLVLTDNRFLGRLRREDVSDAIMRSVNYASHVMMSIKGVSESIFVLNRS